VEAPRIAIAVIVENGGWGASAAAPLAREVADFYLTGRKGEVSAPNSDAPSAQHVRADKNKPAAAPAEEVVE
jgi:penicillin-binding protein 2